MHGRIRSKTGFSRCGLAGNGGRGGGGLVRAVAARLDPGGKSVFVNRIFVKFMRYIPGKASRVRSRKWSCRSPSRLEGGRRMSWRRGAGPSNGTTSGRPIRGSRISFCRLLGGSFSPAGRFVHYCHFVGARGLSIAIS